MTKLLCVLIAIILVLTAGIGPVYAWDTNSSRMDGGSKYLVKGGSSKFYKGNSKGKAWGKLSSKDKDKKDDDDKDEDNDFTINGEKVNFNDPSVIKYNHVLIPVNAIKKLLGADVKWDGKTHIVTITKGETMIIINLDNYKMKVNDKEYKLDENKEFKKNRTVVLLKLITEILSGKKPGDSNTVPGANLALNRPTAASSEEASSKSAGKAVDGDKSTRWSSHYSDSQWIYVDLGASQNVSRVILSWEKAYGKSYKIQVSSDAVNWTDIYTVTNANGGIDDITFNTVSARYVKMVGVKRATRYGYSLWEFEVYSGSGNTQPTPVPTSTPAPTPTPSPTPASKYEAEASALSGGASAANTNSGYSGAGYVNGFWNAGAAAAFTVNTAAAGYYQVELKYANATGSDRTLSIYVNGTKVKQTVLPNLSNWSSWSVKPEVLVLNAGSNTITYKYDQGDTGNVNLDYTKLTLSSGGLTVSSAAAPAKVSLSSQGLLDWVHWGMTDAAGFNRKSGVTQQISNYTKIGSGNVVWLADNPVGYSWTGGTPAVNSSDIYSTIYTTGVGNGFQLTIPADSTQKTLKIYVGAWKAKGKLEAVLSDGTTTAFTDYVDAPSSIGCKVFTIHFKAAADNHTLTIRYTVDTAYEANVGNVTLQAAVLY